MTKIPEDANVLAVVGSREFPNLKAVDIWVRENASRFDFFVSGGADGPDSAALMAWREIMGAEQDKVFPADWNRYGAGAGFIRNVKIIAAASFVSAFWTPHTNGTLDDLGLLFNCGKPFNLYVR